MRIMSLMNTTDTTRISITPDTLTARRIRELADRRRARLRAAGLSEVEAARLATPHALGREALVDAVAILWDQELAASEEELSSGQRVPRKTLCELWVNATDAALEDVRAAMAPPPIRAQLAPTAVLLEAALAGDDAAAQALRGAKP